jgi:Protein of unknown function (DUF2380)
MNQFKLTGIIFSFLMLASSPGLAEQRIAILNFELNDITSLPNTPQEKLRTESIQPLLEQAIRKKAYYQIIHINPEAQTAANSSFGYLFRFDELAAKLGEQHGADWIIVGQHSKPSFLYSYLLAHLIDVKTQALAASFAIELKGNSEKVTQRGVKALANKIHASIRQ